jgi:hypothetical protein
VNEDKSRDEDNVCESKTTIDENRGESNERPKERVMMVCS